VEGATVRPMRFDLAYVYLVILYGCIYIHFLKKWSKSAREVLTIPYSLFNLLENLRAILFEDLLENLLENLRAILLHFSQKWI
jgi:hypothetical protein